MNARPAVLTAGWRTALAGGGLAFVAAAGAGQVLAFGVWLAGGPGSPSTSPKLGWLYFCLFDHVPVRVEALAPGAGRTPVASGTVSAALLGGTAGLAWLLVRAGGRVADRGGGGMGQRMLHGAKVAPVYAIAGLVVSLLVHARIEVPSNPFLGDLTFRPSPLGAFVWPFGIALAAGVAGGYRSARVAPSTIEPWGRRADAVLAGGWRMFLAGLVLSFVGLLVLAAIEPDSTAAYVRKVTASGPGAGALLVGNHLLALPNQSVWVLVVAMGGCDGVYGTGVSLDAICLDRFPEAASLDLFTPETGPTPPVGGAPRSFLLFLLVPAFAAGLGGMQASHRAMAAAEALAMGAFSGVAFAGLMTVAAAMGGIRVAGELFNGAATGVVTYGPRPLQAGLLALAWGVPFGAIGAVGGWRGRQMGNPERRAGNAER
jgi:hypothetical protein